MNKSKFDNTPFETITLGSNVINDPFEISNFLMFQGGYYYKFIDKSKLKIRSK